MKLRTPLLFLCLLPFGFGEPIHALGSNTTIIVPENQKADVGKCVNAMKSLPKEIREAMLAEMSEFLYMDDGSCPFEANGKQYYSTADRCFYKKVKPTAKYIGLDGKPYCFNATLRKLHKNSRWVSKWSQCKLVISQVGWDTIAQFFEQDVQKLQELYAKQLDIL